LWSACFRDGAITLSLAGLMDGWGQAYVLCDLCFVFESFWAEDFGRELCGDCLANAWVCHEVFHFCSQGSLRKHFLDVLFGIFDLLCSEPQLFDERVEGVFEVF